MESAAWSLGGIIAGGLITWWASRWYYIKARDESNEALARILAGGATAQQSINTLGRIVERAGLAECTWDPHTGDLRGLVVKAQASAVIKVDVAASGSVAPPPAYDRQHEQPPESGPPGEALPITRIVGSAPSGTSGATRFRAPPGSRRQMS